VRLGPASPVTRGWPFTGTIDSPIVARFDTAVELTMPTVRTIWSSTRKCGQRT
jgi:hypothetical protein